MGLQCVVIVEDVAADAVQAMEIELQEILVVFVPADVAGMVVHVLVVRIGDAGIGVGPAAG